MLLSDKKTADYIDENFVASWKMVRPVPQLTIEFGNGKTMRRTLAGNTVMYVTLPDGTVVDAFPGVYTPDDFGQLVVPALNAAKEAMTLPSAARADYLAKWHKGRVDAFMQQETVRTTTSKAFVESPILEASGLIAAPPVMPTTLSKAVVEAPILRGAGLKSQAPAVVPSSMFEAYASRIDDISKRPATNAQLKVRMGVSKDAPASVVTEKVLEMDSQVNLKSVHPAVDILLSDPGKRTADGLCATLYKQLLHIDIDDPYLGLRDFSVPGTPDH